MPISVLVPQLDGDREGFFGCVHESVTLRGHHCFSRGTSIGRCQSRWAPVVARCNPPTNFFIRPRSACPNPDRWGWAPSTWSWPGWWTAGWIRVGRWRWWRWWRWVDEDGGDRSPQEDGGRRMVVSIAAPKLRGILGSLRPSSSY